MSHQQIPRKRPRESKQDETEKMDNSEIPITIAMSSDILFENVQDGSGSMSPGPLFTFVKGLKAVNGKLKEKYPDSRELFRVLLIGDNSESLIDTIRKHEMEDLVGELKQEKPHLYLETDPSKAQEAVNAGIAAATVFFPKEMKGVSDTELRFAFDGDAVLFSNGSELVYQNKGLQAFLDHEKENIETEMKAGPFKGFLEALEKLKRKLGPEKCPIRTYLVTSRGAGCAGYRALNTLRVWGLEMDEAVFLGGAKKGPTLARIKPHIFFDDQHGHVKAGLEVGTLACLVPHVSEQPKGK